MSSIKRIGEIPETFTQPGISVTLNTGFIPPIVELRAGNHIIRELTLEESQRLSLMLVEAFDQAEVELGVDPNNDPAEVQRENDFWDAHTEAIERTNQFWADEYWLNQEKGNLP